MALPATVPIVVPQPVFFQLPQELKSNADAANIDKIYCCGPAPMMKAIAKVAKDKDVDCEVSLENMMACGLGACLCCVENTVKGNVCVCTEGPVFNINELTW